MIWLTIFSYVLQVKGANKHIFPIYFYSGIMGAISFLCIGANQPLVGAGVSIMGLVIASIALVPNYKVLPKVFGGIPLWIMGIVYILLQAYTLIEAPIAVDIAIAIGGITGWVYVLLLKNHKDLGKWMHQLLHLLNNSLSPKN
jgi:membrane associated rhomboid family serine protease